MLRVGNTYNKPVTINNSKTAVFVGETLRHERYHESSTVVFPANHQTTQKNTQLKTTQ